MEAKRTDGKTRIAAKLKCGPVTPTVDDIASDGHTGEIVGGTAFATKGSGLDAYGHEAIDNVKVEWTLDGEPKSTYLEPAEVTPTKLAFEAPDEFDDIPSGTDLTFEITIDDVVLTKVAKLVEP